MYKFLPRGTRITVLDGPYTGHRGRVDSIVFQQPTGSEERAFCYLTTLESGKVANVRALSVAPGWLDDDDLAVLLAWKLVPDVTANSIRPRSSVALQQKSAPGLSNSTIVDLHDLTANPGEYKFFTFRPNLEKLILSGAEDTEHISILWYTVTNGSVGLHYHSMTESVYLIDGTQTDAKGVYPTGSLYFNPPGSGHAITDSTGFFILAYASPPDFANTGSIEEYTPVRINTADPHFEKIYPFKKKKDGIWVNDVPLDHRGGISSTCIKSTSSRGYQYKGNYILVLRGSCSIDGTVFPEGKLVVAPTIETQSYDVSAAGNSSCLALGVSF